MRTPTDEQRCVLESPARVRVVRASPGSGKTWLVAEVIRRQLESWESDTSGIAALSFTRVGSDEIRKALGHDIGHPHFVGTLDAFLFRYVVRPFLRTCFPSFAAPRLVPAEWGADHWNYSGQGEKATVGQGTNLFGCVWTDEDQNGRAVASYKSHTAQPLRRLTGSELEGVKAGKRRMWERSGQLTHSDAALWASKVLEHQAFGPAVCAEVVRRFPLLLIDELQDTGYFLGKSVSSLLSPPLARGLLVGDPDQAIFEFNGARPDLFNRFESIPGSKVLLLARSQRCAPAIAETASHLKDSGGRLAPAAERTGRTFLVRYGDFATDVRHLLDSIASANDGGIVKVVARQSATVRSLVGQSSKQDPKLGCPPLNHLQRAVKLFRQARPVGALAAARAALSVAVFGYEGVTEATLATNGANAEEWKALAIRCLLRANGVSGAGNLWEWQCEAGLILEQELSTLLPDVALHRSAGSLRPQKRKDWDKACGDYLPQASAPLGSINSLQVQTVHSVKGETHDLTVFVCPPSKANHCPSHVWWSTNERGREERRIAYVGMTRSRGNLIVCVSGDCYVRLYATRKSFVDSLESMTVAEYVSPD